MKNIVFVLGALAIGSQAAPKFELGLTANDALAFDSKLWDANLGNNFGFGLEGKYYIAPNHGVVLAGDLNFAPGNDYTMDGTRKDMVLNTNFYGLGYSFKMALAENTALNAELLGGVISGTRYTDYVDGQGSTAIDADLSYGFAYRANVGVNQYLGPVIAGLALQYTGGGSTFDEPSLLSSLDKEEGEYTWHRIGLKLNLGYGF